MYMCVSMHDACLEHDIHIIVNDGTSCDVQIIAQRAIFGLSHDVSIMSIMWIIM